MEQRDASVSEKKEQGQVLPGVASSRLWRVLSLWAAKLREEAEAKKESKAA